MSRPEPKIKYTFEDIECPRCGSHTFGIYTDDTVYVCLGEQCPEVMYFCKGCQKLYPKTMYGQKGDTFECKECGRTQWGYTERHRLEQSIYSYLGRQSAALADLEDEIRMG